MKILITGRHVAVTDPMKAYAHAKAEKLMRYFERATSCRVTMDHGPLDFSVEMVIEVSRGVTLFGKARGPDLYAAVDLAEQKLAQQMRKYKERLTDHHRGEGRGARAARAGVRGTRAAAGREPRPEAELTYEDVIEEMRGAD